jgi:hypothetical protein
MCEDLEPPPLPQRHNSKRDVRQEHSTKLVRSKSRHIDKSSEKRAQSKKHDIGALYSELMAVKSEYKKLKGSYETLAKEKVELTQRGVSGPVQLPWGSR